MSCLAHSFVFIAHRIARPFPPNQLRHFEWRTKPYRPPRRSLMIVYEKIFSASPFFARCFHFWAMFLISNSWNHATSNKKIVLHNSKLWTQQIVVLWTETSPVFAMTKYTLSFVCLALSRRWTSNIRTQRRRGRMIYVLDGRKGVWVFKQPIAFFLYTY